MSRKIYSLVTDLFRVSFIYSRLHAAVRKTEQQWQNWYSMVYSH